MGQTMRAARLGLLTVLALLIVPAGWAAHGFAGGNASASCTSSVGLVARCRASTLAAPEASRLRVAIDAGPAIAPEEDKTLAQIWEPFALTHDAGSIYLNGSVRIVSSNFTMHPDLTQQFTTVESFVCVYAQLPANAQPLAFCHDLANPANLRLQDMTWRFQVRASYTEGDVTQPAYAVVVVSSDYSIRAAQTASFDADVIVENLSIDER